MKKSTAIESARFRAAKHNVDYFIVQVKNGQWMVETARYMDTPVGHMLYDNRPKEFFAAPGTVTYA